MLRAAVDEKQGVAMVADGIADILLDGRDIAVAGELQSFGNLALYSVAFGVADIQGCQSGNPFGRGV